ncbi:unnamed protein product [Heterobilharzia americana]|nr:unnamed protein product [Heterobilharzia americana]
MAVKSASSKGGDHKTVSTKSPSESQSVVSIFKEFYKKYKATTPKRLRILDAYLVYILLTGIIQFLYCCLAGTFPFNSFLSGFISCVASFVLGVCLRMHTNPQNKNVFIPFCPESAFADFIFAHIILHLVVFNFIG